MENIRLGYACINSTLSEKEKICCNKTYRLNTVITQGENTGFPKGSEEYSFAIYTHLTECSRKNLISMYKIISWSRKNNIFFYRMSSDMFPHINNPRIVDHMLPEHYDNYFYLAFAHDLLFEIGKYVQKYGIRLSMHPGHYNQLASESEEVIKNTITDLTWHTRLLDLLQLGAESYILHVGKGENILHHGILCIHGGGTYKNKEKSLKRWKKNFLNLHENIQRRICLENCEKSYSVDDLLPLCEELGIPLIFDFHHYNCWEYYHQENPEQSEIRDLLPRILKTWEPRGIIPKFHLSDQAEDKKVGAHHDYVEKIPRELLSLKNIKIDIMIEAKKKELAVFKLYKKYKL
jgi:UV DNA damage endonuclease